MYDNSDGNDRTEQLSGKTLEDLWAENPDPPSWYGRPDPDSELTVVENTALIATSTDKDDELTYYAQPPWVLQ